MEQAHHARGLRAPVAPPDPSWGAVRLWWSSPR